MNSILSGIEYILGEESCDFRTAEGFGTLNIPDRPALWGWGQYRKATSSVLDMQVAAARRSLEAAHLRGSDIDCVIFCHANVPRYEVSPTVAASSFFAQLGLDHAFPVSVGLNGCAALLSGVRLADSLLATSSFKHVLVVAADVNKGSCEQRFQRYAIFSDAACSCVVSSSSSGGLRLMAASAAVDSQGMAADAGFSSELAQQTNGELLKSAGLMASDVSRVFCNNVFLPITMLKESEGGFEPEQIYTDNVKRIAHCYSSDALINFSDFAKAEPIVPGSLFVLAADSPGLRASLLVQSD